jgi:ferredoxin-NADP reductase
LLFSRRTLGLYAFFYGCTHFLLFYGLDRSFSLSSTFSEMLKRKYLFVGITGLLLMVPLAATSTNALIKRLGGPRWRALHRLVYLAAIAGVLHYYMLVKADVRQPLAFAAVLDVLLGYRLVAYWCRPKESQVAGVVKPKMWSGSLRLQRIIQETPEVRTFRLVSPDGGRLPFDFVPGQYLILSLLIAGKRVARTYTIASSPARPAYCELTIKREEHGLASRHLHDHVGEGDLLNVSVPAGRFTFDETKATSVVLIAGGVGITPLMAILRCLTDRNWKGEIHFLYCAKTPRDVIFRQELEDLQRRFPELHLLVTLTRNEGAGWAGRKGRITRDVLSQSVPNLATQQVFICGPTSMMEPMIQVLRDLGVPGEQIRSEAFLAARRTEVAQPASGEEASPLVSPAMTGAPSRDLSIGQP